MLEKKYLHLYLLVCKGVSNDDVGVARGAPYSRIYGRELVSKPVIPSKKSWGGGYRRTTPFFIKPEHYGLKNPALPSPVIRLTGFTSYTDDVTSTSLSDFVPLRNGFYSFRTTTD